MAKPKTLVLTGFGINCDYETGTAFERAGAVSERVHVNDLIDGWRKMSDYQILAFPGGFSYGDDIRSGKVLANKVFTNLAEPLRKFIEDGKLIIGICNGFQVMVNLGLISDLPATKLEQRLTLTYNDSYRYEDRWVTLRGVSDKCIFTRGIEIIYLPVAHGEGKFFADDETIGRIEKNGQVALRYVLSNGERASRSFPANPNGSLNDIAGASDSTGRVFGMMPHPERHMEFTNHPRWTAIKERLKREGRPIPEEGEGMKIFRNAVDYFR
jgi:phosphoribosylformylglycinamidine synthase